MTNDPIVELAERRWAPARPAETDEERARRFTLNEGWRLVAGCLYAASQLDHDPDGRETFRRHARALAIDLLALGSE